MQFDYGISIPRNYLLSKALCHHKVFQAICIELLLKESVKSGLIQSKYILIFIYYTYDRKNTNCIPYFILSIYTHVASVVDIILPAVKDIFLYV